MKNQNIKVNAVLNMTKTICSIAFPLITFPYISRVLSPDNIGKVNFGSSFVNYFTLLASLGITTYAIRECSSKRNDKNELSRIASQIFSINLCTTFMSFVAMIVTLLLFRPFDSYRSLIIIQSTTTLFTTLGCDWLNSAMEDFVYITVRSILFQIISLVLMFLLVKTPEDYIVYATITVISSSGANIVNIFYRKKYCRVRFIKKMDWKKHFQPIVMLFVMSMAQTIFNSSDNTMLGLMKGDYEVGLYSIAVKISHLISQIVSSLAWVIMPRMSFYFAENDYIKINCTLRRVLGVLITLGLPCAVGTISLSKEIILVISGEKYFEASTALIILMFSFSFSLVGGSFLGNMVLFPSKREGTYMKICCVSTVVNLILNYFLIPIWGVNAAALTTAFSSFLIMIMLLATKDQRIKIEKLKEIFISPIVGCLMIVIVCFAVKYFFSNLFIVTSLSVIGSILIYFIIQYVLKNEVVYSIAEVFIVKLKRLHKM